jgi:hypothetical protein
MFVNQGQKEEPGLLRLQKDIARDKLRFQQRLGLVEGARPVEDASRGSDVGRLYEVFVAMGETHPNPPDAV